MGARSTLSTSNDKECRDDPKISWCLSMKDFCHLEAMEESCRRTCKYCTSKNSTGIVVTFYQNHVGIFK